MFWRLLVWQEEAGAVPEAAVAVSTQEGLVLAPEPAEGLRSAGAAWPAEDLPPEPEADLHDPEAPPKPEELRF